MQKQQPTAFLYEFGNGGLSFRVDRLIVGQYQEIGLLQVSRYGIRVFGVRYAIPARRFDRPGIFLAVPPTEIMGTATAYHQNPEGTALTKRMAGGDE